MDAPNDALEMRQDVIGEHISQARAKESPHVNVGACPIRDDNATVTRRRDLEGDKGIHLGT